MVVLLRDRTDGLIQYKDRRINTASQNVLKYMRMYDIRVLEYGTSSPSASAPNASQVDASSGGNDR